MSNALDPAYAAALEQVRRAGVEAGDPLAMPLADARARQDRYFAFLAQDLPPVASVRDVRICGPAGDITLRLVAPLGADTSRSPVIVFVRGAGWWAGTLDSHERSMRVLANASGCVVCGVDYHCAPERQFPVQRDEVVAAVRWLRTRADEHGMHVNGVALTGESAGANLCALATARLNAEAPGTVGALALFYGNYALPGPDTRAYSHWVWSNYLGVPREQLAERAPREAIPLLAGVSVFPPTWLGVGECDPLLGDTLQMAARLRDAGVTCEVRRYPGVPHAFVMASRLYDGAASALADAAAALRRLMNN